jgi:hypothetical protein
MPSISHRASLGQRAPHRAKSGPAALPAGFIGGYMTAIAGWLTQWREDWCEDWRSLCDIGLTEAHDSAVAPTRRDRHDPKGLPTWPTIF